MHHALVPLAVGEISDGTLLAYSLGLIVSGLLMLVVGATGFPKQTSNARIIDVVAGVAFLGYAIYLLFFLAEGGTVFILYYVFVLPIFLIYRAFQSMRSARS